MHSPETWAEGSFTLTHACATPLWQEEHLAGAHWLWTCLPQIKPRPSHSPHVGANRPQLGRPPEGPWRCAAVLWGARSGAAEATAFPATARAPTAPRLSLLWSAVHGEPRSRHHRTSSPPSLQQVVEKASRMSRPLQLPARASPRRSLLPRAIWSLLQGFRASGTSRVELQPDGGWSAVWTGRILRLKQSLSMAGAVGGGQRGCWTVGSLVLSQDEK